MLTGGNWSRQGKGRQASMIAREFVKFPAALSCGLIRGSSGVLQAPVMMSIEVAGSDRGQHRPDQLVEIRNVNVFVYNNHILATICTDVALASDMASLLGMSGCGSGAFGPLKGRPNS